MSTSISSAGVRSADSAASDAIVSVNPATLEALGRVPIVPPEAVSALAEKARAAWPAWAARPFRERGRALLAARRHLLAHLDDFALTITQENGKPLVESLTAELYPIADLLYYFAQHAERLLAGHAVPTGLMRWLGRASRMTYPPVGVVGVIAPWNYPFSIPAGICAMALVTGNAVLCKPSSVTPLVGLKIAEMFAAAGLPTDCFTLLPGRAATGEALCAAPIDKLVFTGSVEAGKAVMRACADRCLPCVIELGGKDPMIVRADADVDHAASGAVWGAFSNAGQCCAAVERVYVHHAVAETFIDRVVDKTRRLRQGLGTDVHTDIGPLTTAAQLAVVERQVEDARAHGAQVLTGGERHRALPGHFYLPTVLTQVDHTHAVMREETFGPILPIMAVADDAEAIRLANDTPFGLTASIWTRDLQAAERMARQLRVGTVTINECVYTHAICQTPWGGRGHSGFGRTHGRLGLMEFVHPHHVHTNRRPQRKSLWWYPYNQTLYDLFRALTRRVTSGFGGLLLGLPRLLSAMRLPKI
ncbi:MAG: aldehyde dehydrogenase family protein [Deltaproteobacteria bacterium]|nr:aldehyde dehydrogenase family protein [Deltaproteobacteria bacterium]